MFGSGSPTAVTGCPPPNTAAISRACATLVSWYSSKSTVANRSRYWRGTPRWGSRVSTPPPLLRRGGGLVLVPEPGREPVPVLAGALRVLFDDLERQPDLVAEVDHV